MQTKLTKTQVEQVLSAHCAGQLVGGGSPDFIAKKGCLVQVAFNWPENTVLPSELDERTAYSMQQWFDDNYLKCWSVEEFIEKLIEQKFF